MDTTDRTGTADAKNADATGAGAKDDPYEPQIERYADNIRQFRPDDAVVVTQSRRGALIALNGRTGAPLWRWDTGSPEVSATFDGQQVYANIAAGDRPFWIEIDAPPDWRPQGGPNDPRSRAFHIRVFLVAVIALSAQDGVVRWRITRYISGNAKRLFLDGASLITTMLSFDNKAHEVIALDCATGGLRWSRAIGPLADPFGYFSRSQLLWADGGQATIALDTRPTAKDRPSDPPYAVMDTTTDGAIIWRGDEIPEPPMVVRRRTWGGVTFQRAERTRWPHDFLRAMRVGDGAELWRVPQSDSPGMLPLASDLLACEGRVLLLSRSTWVTRIYALEAATGRVMWRWRSPRWLLALWLLRQAWQRLQEAQRTGAWRAVWDDTLHARWRRPVQPEGDPAQEAAHGRVYVATYLGVFALRAQDGHRLWHALPLKTFSKLYVARDDSAPATV